MRPRITLKTIYVLGAVATLFAALVFRRNISAEISLFMVNPAPISAADWFALLQSNSLLGMGLLNIFDSVNYVLLGVMFAALYFALRQTNRGIAATATGLGFAGIAVYLASNTSFAMLSLSSQYTAVSTDVQKTTLLAAGQSILSSGAPGAVYEGTGGYVSLTLIALAGALISVAMFKSGTFNKATTYLGMVACALDLAYIAGLAFVPETQIYLLSTVCIATAGLFLMGWHLLIGLKLYKLSKTTQANGGVN